MEQGRESCPSAPPAFRLSHQNSNNFSHKGRGFNERGISTHALEKLHKKRQNSDFFLFFFYIFTKNKSPPNLATREVEQPLMVEREGASCPASSSFKVPSHGQQESTALVAGANVGLATRGLGLEAPQFIRSLVSR